MPKKKHPEKPEDQAKRFRAKVQELIDAGELSPTDADDALDKLVRQSQTPPKQQFRLRNSRSVHSRKGVEPMAKVSPFHSKLPGTEVYHNDNKCTVGNNIETYNRVSGTGGLRLCSVCKDL